MLINEVMKITGLTKRAIRFYERKGLLSIQRQGNGYRIYSDEDIIILKKIKLLRSCGISISNIKLLFANIITLEELIEKRKKEIENENGYQISMFANILNIFQEFENGQYDLDMSFDENVDMYPSSDNLALGIDIGTTSISAAVVDIEKKITIDTYTIPNDSNIITSNSNFKEQDPNIIYSKVKKLIELIVSSYSFIKSIGFTGQMHGIVYINKQGRNVSNLITWQDKRADEIFENNNTYCDKIYKTINKKIYTGFGFATHYYNSVNGIVPNDAFSFCSIMDYIVLQLTGQTIPILHSSVAASFGLFNIETMAFDDIAISKLGIDNLHLPKVTDEYKIVGNYEKIPVSIAIGDNQASFIGTVKNIDESILVNIGTGSQISMSINCLIADDMLELRPLVKEKYILCGSALCGGSAYALLENFFRSYLSNIEANPQCQYKLINELAYNAYMQKLKPLKVNTSFSGKRSDITIKGSIGGITVENFTPGQLALGFIYGICEELNDFIKGQQINKKIIVASGNAVKKIPIMKQVIEDVFKMQVKVSHSNEEASVGACLFSAVASNMLKSIYDIEEFINYGE